METKDGCVLQEESYSYILRPCCHLYGLHFGPHLGTDDAHLRRTDKVVEYLCWPLLDGAALPREDTIVAQQLQSGIRIDYTVESYQALKLPFARFDSRCQLRGSERWVSAVTGLSPALSNLAQRTDRQPINIKNTDYNLMASLEPSYNGATPRPFRSAPVSFAVDI
jgi:hypothetical protein